jgi:hypothetical protein
MSPLWILPEEMVTSVCSTGILILAFSYLTLTDAQTSSTDFIHADEWPFSMESQENDKIAETLRPEPLCCLEVQSKKHSKGCGRIILLQCH